jgi:hypothetical protein
MLDKMHSGHKMMSLDDFEQEREGTRRTSRKQLKLSRSDRNNILINECGFTPAEINRAWADAMQIRQQREETIQRGYLLSTVDDFFDTVNRKYQLVTDIRKCL